MGEGFSVYRRRNIAITKPRNPGQSVSGRIPVVEDDWHDKFLGSYDVQGLALSGWFLGEQVPIYAVSARSGEKFA